MRRTKIISAATQLHTRLTLRVVPPKSLQHSKWSPKVSSLQSYIPPSRSHINIQYTSDVSQTSSRTGRIYIAEVSYPILRMQVYSLPSTRDGRRIPEGTPPQSRVLISRIAFEGPKSCFIPWPKCSQRIQRDLIPLNYVRAAKTAELVTENVEKRIRGGEDGTEILANLSVWGYRRSGWRGFRLQTPAGNMNDMIGYISIAIGALHCIDWQTPAWISYLPGQVLTFLKLETRRGDTDTAHGTGAPSQPFSCFAALPGATIESTWRASVRLRAVLGAHLQVRKRWVHHPDQRVIWVRQAGA
ncbi:hypothetical protein DFH08DRAFT_936717 [Mycena albidolilacea]|uniref:Uncharacterized protein n=1 Tax=Mycena albidolilacea TaxID=1033008 RepID=A0AAD7ER69_9AGAR|nr:hypothetical protein DFH08DRAFT_936717 [Mycena albidolilacea]